jgi:hypothetical protein
MYDALLKNKWSLLAFLVITLAGVQLFIGSPGESPVEQAPQQELALSNPEAEEVAQEPAPVDEIPNLDGFYAGAGESEYVEDEELIDSAEGFDPTPTDEEESDEEMPDDLSAAEEEAAASGELVP